MEALQKKTTHNSILTALYRADQKDRQTQPIITPEITDRDRQRCAVVLKILKDKKIITAVDNYKAALILHHSQQMKDYRIARRLAKKSMELGYPRAGWLFAATTDRMLINSNKPQKYGTQFFKKNTKSEWVLYPYDKHTTDAERAKFNVPSIKDQLLQIEKLNSRDR